MKKIIAIAAALFILGACEKNKTTSLCAVYEGILPAADGEGIQITINLNKNNKFKNQLIYIGKEDGTFYEEGNYTIQNRLIELKTEDEISYYRLEDDKIRLLDYEKNEITGQLADMNVLKKTRDCQ